MSGRRAIDPSYVVKGMRYEEYRKLIDTSIMTGKPAVNRDAEDLLEYSRLNAARMKRLDQTTEIIPPLKAVIAQIDKPQTWLVLIEAWCGDAAQTVPIFDKVARLNPNIDLKFLLRDENPGLMDQYLTNGKSRSIPKLIVVDENMEELFDWGPRPKVLQEMIYHMKSNAIDTDAIKKEIHRWYAGDKTVTTQKEILLLNKLAQKNLT